MKCRICGEEIVFIKGKQPGHKRAAMFAVHRSRLEDTLKQTNGEKVAPNLSYQRKLRADLEERHPAKQNTAAAIERMDTDLDNQNLVPSAEGEDSSTSSGSAQPIIIDPLIARTSF